jgi:succinate dehydrogenase / fumarate reductase, cytochrome b subunit
VVALAALGFHLYHGIWSSLRTLGASKASANPLRRPATAALALVVWLGFTVIPIAVFAGAVGPRRSAAAPAVPTPATAPRGGGE